MSKKHYYQIVGSLWNEGIEETHRAYPDLSIEQLTIANEFYNSFRCEGCHCGSCVPLDEFANNLDTSPEELKPIAELAIKLGKD